MTNNTTTPSFSELFDQNYSEPTEYRPAQKIIASIVRIGNEWTFINLGAKSEGFFSTKEIQDENGSIEVKEGDNITVYYLSTSKNGLLFTTKLGSGYKAKADLEEAFQCGIPVEGTVEKEIKGGFQVKIGGSIRGFCPYSQAGLKRTEADKFIDSKILFRIIEYREQGKNVVVSHRAVLEEQQQEILEALQETLKPGMTVHGVVSSIHNFGAFITIDEGLEGLIPISEICWGHIDDINERLSVGQELDVIIMKLDWQEQRFSFSLKNATPDPWLTVAETYQIGTTHQGIISRIATFGAFITLEEGIDGLAHIRTLGGGKRLNHPRELVKEGQEIEVRVDTVDVEQKRISLSPTTDLWPSHKAKQPGETETKQDPNKEYKEYQARKSTDKKTTSLGTFGDLLKAKLGSGQK